MYALAYTGASVRKRVHSLHVAACPTPERIARSPWANPGGTRRDGRVATRDSDGMGERGPSATGHRRAGETGESAGRRAGRTATVTGASEARWPPLALSGRPCPNARP